MTDARNEGSLIEITINDALLDRIGYFALVLWLALIGATGAILAIAALVRLFAWAVSPA